MPRRQADPRLVEIWQQIGEAIASGDIQGLFVVWEQADGIPTHGCACRAKDVHALIDEVRHQAIRARSRPSH